MMHKFTEWTSSNPLFFTKIENSELKNWKSSLILGKSSLSECEKSKKFSSTPSELVILFLVHLVYLLKIILEIENRE